MSQRTPMAAADLRQQLDREMAVRVEALYLINLMLLPVLSFLILLILYYRHYDGGSSLVRNHLRQTVGTSVFGGLLLFIVMGSILWFFGFNSGYTLMALVLYFTAIHTSLILFGAIGLSKAMAGQCVRYPVIGRFFLAADKR